MPGLAGLMRGRVGMAGDEPGFCVVRNVRDAFNLATYRRQPAVLYEPQPRAVSYR